MNKIKYFLVFFITFTFVSFESNSFPKRKNAISQEEIDREKFEHVYDAGYHFAYMEYCNYAMASNKDLYKRIKGLVAYTNWDLFLEFNKGVQGVHHTLVAAGVGWGGSGTYSPGTWVQHDINWKYGLNDNCSSNSMKKVYSILDNVFDKVVIKFLLERDNYQDNLLALITALQSDKKDDYSYAIQKLKISSESYGSSNTMIASDESNEEYTTTNVSIDKNNSGSTTSIRDQLRELKSLYEDELITEDDYNSKKTELLDQL